MAGMAREHDVVVFGASGFTGARVARELLLVARTGTKQWCAHAFAVDVSVESMPAWFAFGKNV